jgi:hypothetical protein
MFTEKQIEAALRAWFASATDFQKPFDTWREKMRNALEAAASAAEPVADPHEVCFDMPGATNANG